MNTYIISYDLVSAGQNYEALLKKIHSYSSWARLGGSSYIIATEETAVQVRDKLMTVLDGNDKLFVSVVNAPAAWTTSLGDKVSQWIRNNLR
jgi:hypothetical protein